MLWVGGQVSKLKLRELLAAQTAQQSLNIPALAGLRQRLFYAWAGVDTVDDQEDAYKEWVIRRISFRGKERCLSAGQNILKGFFISRRPRACLECRCCCFDLPLSSSVELGVGFKFTTDQPV